MEHAPVPWSHKHDIGVYDNNGRLLVEPSCRIGYDEAIANARLIAAAPDLLEAAQKALQYLADRGFANGQIGASLHNAISKATNA